MRQVEELLRKEEPESNEISEEPTARLYRVQDDDDLCSIAARLYGLADFWVFIYSANADQIMKSGGIHPGQILYVPDL